MSMDVEKIVAGLDLEQKKSLYLLLSQELGDDDDDRNGGLDGDDDASKTHNSVDNSDCRTYGEGEDTEDEEEDVTKNRDRFLSPTLSTPSVRDDDAHRSASAQLSRVKKTDQVDVAIVTKGGRQPMNSLNPPVQSVSYMHEEHTNSTLAPTVPSNGRAGDDEGGNRSHSIAIVVDNLTESPTQMINEEGTEDQEEAVVSRRTRSPLLDSAISPCEIDWTVPVDPHSTACATRPRKLCSPLPSRKQLAQSANCAPTTTASAFQVGDPPLHSSSNSLSSMNRTLIKASVDNTLSSPPMRRERRLTKTKRVMRKLTKRQSNHFATFLTQAFVNQSGMVHERRNFAARSGSDLLLRNPAVAFLLCRLSHNDQRGKVVSTFGRATGGAYASNGQLFLPYLAIKKEVENVDSMELILRGGGVYPPALSEFFLVIGRRYLSVHLRDTVQAILMKDKPLEIEEARLPPGADRTVPAKTLTNCVTLFLNRVFSSVESIPSALVYTLGFLNKMAIEKFGDAARNAMVGFFFLRFINPALSQPEVYGLAETSELTPLKRRNLFLVAKVVQMLANQSKTTAASDIMEFKDLFGALFAVIEVRFSNFNEAVLSLYQKLLENPVIEFSASASTDPFLSARRQDQESAIENMLLFYADELRDAFEDPISCDELHHLIDECLPEHQKRLYCEFFDESGSISIETLHEQYRIWHQTNSLERWCKEQGTNRMDLTCEIQILLDARFGAEKREHVFELPLPCLSKENIIQCVREKVDKGRIHVLVQEGPNGEQFEIPIEMSRLVRCGTLSNSKKLFVVEEDSSSEGEGDVEVYQMMPSESHPLSPARSLSLKL